MLVLHLPIEFEELLLHLDKERGKLRYNKSFRGSIDSCSESYMWMWWMTPHLWLVPITSFYRMGLTGIFCFSTFLFIPVESTGREGNMWLQNLGAESRGTVSLTVFSASIFVVAALVLSMYLVFEHLASYNQPEVNSVFTFNWLSYFTSVFFFCNIVYG